MKLITLALFLALIGCVSNRRTQKEHSNLSAGPLPEAHGPWENIYNDDSRLAAVAVHQYPENPYEASSYIGKHPCNIWYAFWDGRVRQIQYDVDGTVIDDFWWPEDFKLTQNSDQWNGFDFSFGSDPTFLHHKDPRPKLKSS
ncbi:hypothetical protein [Prosthecobacter sp.]